MPLLRALYRPFFPPTSSPSSPPPQPSLSPTQPPSLSPFPKYPSSATNRPFFPIYPSPPPPPPPSLPTYPANISSLTIPQSSRNGPHHPNSSKLLTSIFLPILALLLITSLSIFYLHLRRRRRRRRSFGNADDSRSDSHRLFPPNSAPSDGQKLQTSSRPTSSEFLYLGTLVNSRADTGSAAAAVVPPSTGESPELRPLPPLSRQVKQGFGNADVGCSSEEEFYSPKASPGSRRTSQVVAKLENVSSKSSTSSSDLCLSSSLPVSSSPSASTVEPVSSSKVADGDIGQDLDERSKLSGFSGGNLQSPTSIGEFSRNPFAFRPPEKQPPAPPFLMPPRYRAVESNRRIKVKPLHWNNVPAISDRATAWDWMKSSSFQVNDGTIEALFACNGVDTALKRRQEEEEKMVIDPKKSQNIGILIEALNVSTEDVCEALLEGNVDILSIELLETLRRMAPRKEEELKLKECDDASLCRLGPAEKFLKAMLEVPFAFKRVDALLYVAKFQSEVDYLMQSFETLEAASEELRNSQLFLRILDAVLKAGNHINMGTNQGIAHGFKLDTLLKLVYIKAADGKTTLLDYILQEIIKMEGSRLLTPKNHVNASQGDQECKMLGLQVVSRLSDELIDVKKAAGMDVDVLSSCSSQLAAGIEKVREVVRLNMLDVATRNGQLFHEAMQGFLKRAEGEIVNVQAREGIAVSLVRELTEYFHGDSANEEGHPLKIFMVIRDFLFVLDQVCKQVSRANDRGFFSMQMPFPGGWEHEFIVDVSHHSCIKARSF